MEKFIINGVEFCDFGKNNYTCGMHAVTAYPVDENFWKEVLEGKYPGIFLNPSVDCRHRTEFFGVWGTPEQYREFHKKQQDACIAQRVIDALGGPEAMLRAGEPLFSDTKRAIMEAYQDWWLL